MKRAFDLSTALAGLLFLWPLFILIALLIKLDSEGPVFFRQERVGRGFRPFRIYKFRTMVSDAPERGGQITCGADPRITRIGRILRKTKMDELPQLINVLADDMSLVGPRPEVRRYVEWFRDDYEEILTVLPGITDLASLTFRDEAAILAASPNPEEMYVTSILPAKLDLGKEYVRGSSLALDIAVIFRTLGALMGLESSIDHPTQTYTQRSENSHD
jgi:lipopolysaccharide/colanic/teichoic acid biosynthesis glycosyltransferase